MQIQMQGHRPADSISPRQRLSGLVQRNLMVWINQASEEHWVFQPHLHSGSSNCNASPHPLPPASLPHLVILQSPLMPLPKHLWVQPFSTPIASAFPLCHHHLSLWMALNVSCYILWHSFNPLQFAPKGLFIK